MANISKSTPRPWNQPGSTGPWNDTTPFANAKRHNGGFYHKPQWRHLRNHYIKQNPLCEICQRNGFVAKGYFVDHIIPMSQGGEAYDEDNLQTLCKRCHAGKTNREIAQRRK